MVNITLYWLLLVPLLIGALHMWTLRKNWREGLVVTGLSTAVGAILTVAFFFISIGSQTTDIEIWNGKVTSKERVHGSYVRSYLCNCRNACTDSGNTRSCTTNCDTCYEDRYTVHWYCHTTIGRYTIDYEDWNSRRVYSLPDVPRWLAIEEGDPVSAARQYTNYIQAVPETLFKPASAELKKKFAPLIPAYPDKVYDFYHVDRFLSPGISVAEAKRWNVGISELLKDRGPKKQVNLVVVAAKTADPNYEFALRDAWQNANKNDVVLVLGTPSWPKIEWVRVITWSKSELFKVELRDRVLELGEAKPETVLKVVGDQIDKNFERRRMREFEYLKGEIDPPMWVIVLMIVLQVGAAAGVQYYIHKHYYSKPNAGRRSFYNPM